METPIQTFYNSNYKEKPKFSLIKFITQKKVIFGAFAIILIVEGIWAFKALYSPYSKTNGQLPANTVYKKPASTSLSLKTTKNTFKVGENIPVTIEEHAQKPTAGTDVIINYDPKFLTVVLDEQTKKPVKTGNFYNEYLDNSLDENTGQISVSGISTSSTGRVILNGIFGLITFQAKVAGTAIVRIDYVPNTTTHSNIIDAKTSKQLLEEVNNLTVNIIP